MERQRFPFILFVIFAFVSLNCDASLQRKKKEILDKLLDPNKYDPQMKPGVSSDFEMPTTVAISLHVLSISSIDDIRQMFTVEMYVRQRWKDERLEYQSPTHQIEYIILNEQHKIWVPDLFFVNEYKSHFHELMEPNSFMKIYQDGTVLSSARVTLTLRCPMKFQMYPMDTQTCSLRIESYKWLSDQINLEWMNGTAVTVHQEILNPNFILEKYWMENGLIAVASGEYSTVQLNFQFVRKFEYYLIQVYIPCCMTVIASILPFWLNPRLVTSRVLIGTIILVSTSYHILTINSQVPKVPYTKAIDIFTGMTLTFIFFALIETVFVHISESRNTRIKSVDSVPKDDVEQSERAPQKPNAIIKMKAWLYDDHETLNDIDAASRALFPVCFLLFIFIYTLTCVSLRAT